MSETNGKAANLERQSAPEDVLEGHERKVEGRGRREFEPRTRRCHLTPSLSRCSERSLLCRCGFQAEALMTLRASFSLFLTLAQLANWKQPTNESSHFGSQECRFSTRPVAVYSELCACLPAVLDLAPVNSPYCLMCRFPEVTKPPQRLEEEELVGPPASGGSGKRSHGAKSDSLPSIWAGRKWVMTHRKVGEGTGWAERRKIKGGR